MLEIVPIMSLDQETKQGIGYFIKLLERMVQVNEPNNALNTKAEQAYRNSINQLRLLNNSINITLESKESDQSKFEELEILFMGAYFMLKACQQTIEKVEKAMIQLKDKE